MKAKIEFIESHLCFKSKLFWNTRAVGFKARRESSVRSDNTMMSMNVCVAYIEKISNILKHVVYP